MEPEHNPIGKPEKHLNQTFITLGSMSNFGGVTLDCEKMERLFLGADEGDELSVEIKVPK